MVPKIKENTILEWIYRSPTLGKLPLEVCPLSPPGMFKQCVRSSKYMASYNMAMQNFCFLLGPSLGASVRFSLEGVIGTMLALGNVLLINRAFGSYMNGGAFATRTNVTDVALGQMIYDSEWLPLCNLGTGERFVQTNSTAESGFLLASLL